MLYPISFKVERLPLLEQEKECCNCGKKFKTFSNHSKYCEECRIIIRRTKQTESKRRWRAKQRLLKEQENQRKSA